MKYIYCLLITLIIINNSLSNDRMHYQSGNSQNAIHTLPNNGYNRHADKMLRIEAERQRQANLIQTRRLQDLEQHTISRQLGITNTTFVVR